MPARILIVSHEALFFTTHRLPIGRALMEMGCEVHVAVPHMERYSDQIRDLGFDRHLIPLVRGGMNPLAELRLMFAFARLFRRVKPDLVHFVGMKPAVFGGPPETRLLEAIGKQKKGRPFEGHPVGPICGSPSGGGETIGRIGGSNRPFFGYFLRSRAERVTDSPEESVDRMRPRKTAQRRVGSAIDLCQRRPQTAVAAVQP